MSDRRKTKDGRPWMLRRNSKRRIKQQEWWRIDSDAMRNIFNDRRNKMSGVQIIPNGKAWSIKDYVGYGATYTTTELIEIRNILNHMTLIVDERVNKNRRGQQQYINGRRNITQYAPDRYGGRRTNERIGRREIIDRRSNSNCHRPENRKS